MTTTTTMMMMTMTTTGTEILLIRYYPLRVLVSNKSAVFWLSVCTNIHGWSSVVILLLHLSVVLLNNQKDSHENTNKPENQLAYGLHTYLDS
jgi:hypothetical protein